MNKHVDHRWSARQNFEYCAVVAAGRGIYDVQLCNLGIGGAAFTTIAGHFVKDQRLTIRFGVGGRHYNLPAVVIWVNLNKVGIMFTEFSAECVQALRGLLYPT